MIAQLKERVIGGWKTSLIGATEGTMYSGIGMALDNPKAAKAMFILAVWKFAKNLLSK